MHHCQECIACIGVLGLTSFIYTYIRIYILALVSLEDPGPTEMNIIGGLVEPRSVFLPTFYLKYGRSCRH